MKLLIATDAWQPQVNGVVRTMGIVIDTMRARVWASYPCTTASAAV